MQQTSQFHLNQWELTDRIRMEDFNGDNQKLETALASLAAADAAEQQARTAQDAAIRREAAAAAEAVPLVKLLEVPVTQEAAQVDVDVSQIDFTQYTEVWIVPILSTAYHYIYLRCNNIATDSYFHPGTHQNYLCRLEMSGLLGQGKAKIRLATYLSPIACICAVSYTHLYTGWQPRRGSKRPETPGPGFPGGRETVHSPPCQRTAPMPQPPESGSWEPSAPSWQKTAAPQIPQQTGGHTADGLSPAQAPHHSPVLEPPLPARFFFAS